MSSCDAFELSLAKVFVYLHKRPDGSVFYVGKGSRYRANEFSPTRRTKHHANIVAKYGRENVSVQLIPCLYEKEAFELEKVLISIHGADGRLCNLTKGGEGAAGHKPSDRQLAALARGRLPGKAKPATMDNILLGRKKGAKALKEWCATDAGKEHIAKIVAARLAKRTYRTVSCACCGAAFETMSFRAKCCGKVCQQRLRRANGGK